MADSSHTLQDMDDMSGILWSCCQIGQIPPPECNVAIYPRFQHLVDLIRVSALQPFARGAFENMADWPHEGVLLSLVNDSKKHLQSVSHADVHNAYACLLGSVLPNLASHRS